MNNDDQCRDVYAHAGLALYLVQVLERALVNAMVAARLPERDRVTRGDIDAFRGEQFEKPLGRLIAGLRRLIPVPETLLDELQDALRRRTGSCITTSGSVRWSS
jgi:hypothetical protein